MGKKNNVIEINGTRYEARTGAVLGPSQLSSPKQAAVKMTSAVKKPTMNDVVRHPGKHAAAHRPKTTQTLMRQSVRKPAAAPRKHSRAQGHVQPEKPAVSAVLAPKKSVYQVSDKRLKKARTVAQSKLITHFAPVTSDSNTYMEIAATAPAAAQPVPAGLNMDLTAKPARRPAKPQTTSELLETALRQATSHEQKPVRIKRAHKFKKRAGIASASVLSLALIAAIGSSQLSSLKLHMASAKAGFSVALPDYKPAGFSLSKLDYSSGIASTTFRSNSDSRTYTLTQKPSAWDSPALRDGFVVQRDKNYRTVDAAGRTVFIYGNHNATWVNAGVWYTVQTDGALSDRQLADLATSL